MSAQRKAIRNGLKAYLTGKTVAQDRIYTNRSNAVWESELPAILLYTRDEQSEVFDQAPRRYRRQANILLECIVEMNDDIDDMLDDFGASIEKQLFNNDLLEVDGVELCDDSVLNSVEMFITDMGKKTVGIIRLDWTFDYYQEAPGEDKVPDGDFETAHFDYALAPNDDVVMEDDVELPQ